MPVASARPYRERQSNQSTRAPGQRARGGGCSFWTSQNAASLKEKLDCALAAGWQWRGHGVGDSKAPGYFHLSFRGRKSAIKMLPTNQLPLGRKSHWRSGSTASRQLSEVKHVPAQLVLRWVTTLEPWVQNIFTLRLATLGMCQPPRELNPGPQRSLCRGGDPVGNRTMMMMNN